MHRSPLRSIWFEPSQTIARIAHENPGYRLYLLPILAGLAVWPTSALFPTEDNGMENGILLCTLLSFGPVLEVLQVLVGAYLIRVSGIWLGGQAGVESIQSAIAWGNVPIVVLAILGIPLMVISALYADANGTRLSPDQSSLATGIAAVLFIIQLVMAAWSFGIYLKGLAKVQGYTLACAILNSIIAWAIPAVIVATAAVLLGNASDVPRLFLTGFDGRWMLSAP